MLSWIDDWMEVLHISELGGWPKGIEARLEVRDISAKQVSILQEPHAADVAVHVRRYLSRGKSISAGRTNSLRARSDRDCLRPVPGQTGVIGVFTWRTCPVDLPLSGQSIRAKLHR
jgi:hypothetical protein